MIEYEEDWLLKLLFQRQGSVAATAALYGLFSASLALVLLVAAEWDTTQTISNLIKEISKSQLWNASTVVIVMLLGFRTKTAMSRFWEGTSLLHQMRGEWFDTVSNCVTFSIGAKTAKLAEVTRFRHTLVRLMSLCHATALEEIASSTIKLEAIDTFGLDRKTLQHLTDCQHKYRFNQVEIMVHLIQTLIIAAHEEGVLKIPPPILSRVFQTLSRGFVNLLNAKKICDTRFPFPYAQCIAMLLIISTILTPLQIVAVVDAKIMVVVFTFVPVWGFVALNLIANQLEDPFGTDSNDLPLEHFQSEMNSCLLMLLHPDSDHIPSVQSSCQLAFKDLLAQVKVGEGQSIRYSHSFAEHMSRRLSSMKAMRSDASSNGDGPEGITMGRISSDSASDHASDHASVVSSHADAHLQVVEVPETKSVYEALEAENLSEGFTVPPVPAISIQFARESGPPPEEKHLECEAMLSLSNWYAEPFSQETVAAAWSPASASTASLPACTPQVAPMTTPAPDADGTAAEPASWTPQATWSTTLPPGTDGTAGLAESSPQVELMLPKPGYNMTDILHKDSVDATFLPQYDVSSRALI